MARTLSASVQDEIRTSFLACGSIKRAAKDARVSRNAARNHLRSEGLSVSPPTGQKLIEAPITESDTPKLTLWALDFSLLEQLFQRGKNNLENLSFTEHITKITQSLAHEHNVVTATDQLRLETAVAEYILYRRFFLMSLNASGAEYVGPFLKSHDKRAKAVVSWTEASQKALSNFLRLIRELEIKNRQPHATCGKNTVFVANQQINLRSRA